MTEDIIKQISQSRRERGARYPKGTNIHDRLPEIRKDHESEGGLAKLRTRPVAFVAHSMG